MKFSKAYADFVQRLRVPSGFLFAAAFVWLARPTARSLSVGLPLAALGMALRAWAAGHLRKNEQLVTSGPYAWMRNPLYAGTLLAAMGFVAAAAQWWLLVLFGLLFVLVYGPVMQNEEGHLRKLFAGYEDYARRVPLLWPRVPRERGAGEFEAALYWRNQEWKGLLAYALVAAFLIWKSREW